MKKEKSTVGRFGGGDYIHKYTIKDAVDDKAIVPLIYEGRFVDQKVDEDNTLYVILKYLSSLEVLTVLLLYQLPICVRAKTIYCQRQITKS